ncbi:phage tail protein [Tropicibacter alexandrii]|uniref:phage tail protein n=1 Tax=Tropicibacter alexandrii TaxID=2267683 RepID=UPI000EF4613A|nr:tail fiber protein [Tropicibacter alexandrii]
MTCLISLKSGLGALALAAASLVANVGPAAAQEGFIGQVTAFPYTFCPRSWARADGSLLPISSNTALFSILGTTYGGDGRTTFALPDLQGRSAINVGHGPGLNQIRLGQKSGAPTMTITNSELPQHSHGFNAVQAEGDRGRPNSDFIAGGSELIYHDGPADVQMANGMIGNSGGGQPIAAMPPYIAMTWCVAVQGIYPSRS